jgi:hypothetical protein
MFMFILFVEINCYFLVESILPYNQLITASSLVASRSTTRYTIRLILDHSIQSAWK